MLSPASPSGPAPRHTNALAHETSPYLRQHAHNPVDWLPWSEAAWERARRENKLVLVSIGYAACHWCHVMERESFEDEGVAAAMNRDFICLKIDREERPDIDQVYIEAVQLMTGRAGWPLNCFCLPDGRPVYGGTYFPVEQWTHLLGRLHDLWREDAVSLAAQAEKLTAALRRDEVAAEAKPAAASDLVLEGLREAVERAKLMFDRAEGGAQRAPKFPLPVNWRFLLRYGHWRGDKAVLDQVKLTLDKMADGGIHDQIGGGFARYSVDGIWKVPHFEKMLYDNGQLLGLYAQGYAVFGDTRYRDVAENIVAFLQRDLRDDSGLFYASLDADSEGVEGKYYVWTRAEVEAALAEDTPWFAAVHGIDARGEWEHGTFILLNDADTAGIASRFGMTAGELRERDRRACARLLDIRRRRIPPGLDDKVLVSWNALAMTGLVEAGLWLRRDDWIEDAEKAARTLLDRAMGADGSLRRSRQRGQFAIAGFLEDYAHLAYALLQLHRATQAQAWLEAAERLVAYALEHFSDAAGRFFHFTSDLDAPLVARKLETQDNVLPSANGVMARCLWRLGEALERPTWRRRAETLVQSMLPEVEGYALAYAGWAEAALEMHAKHFEVRVFGPQAIDRARDLARRYLPHVRLALGPADAQAADGRGFYVVCRENVCEAPMTAVDAVIAAVSPS